MKKKYLTFIIPIMIALIVRVVIYMEFIESAFQYYQTLTGLDMKTLFNSGTSFFSSHKPFLLYEGFIGVVTSIFGKDNIQMIVLFQMLMGVATTFFITYIILKLTGKKKVAIIFGSIAALYAPLLVYEIFILKEAFYLFIASLTLFLLLFVRSSHNTPRLLFLLGAISILPGTIRVSGFLWTLFLLLWTISYLIKKSRSSQKGNKLQKQLIALSAGIVFSFIFIVTYNSIQTGSPLTSFGINIEYYLKSGETIKSKTINTQPENKKQPVQKNNSIDKILWKSKQIVNSFQCPNNINYYFVRSEIPIINYTIDPVLLMPFNLLGILLLLIYYLKRLFKKKLYPPKEFCIFLFFLAYAIPLLMFQPIGRYKLIFLPAIIFFASYAILRIKQALFIKNQKEKFVSLIIILISAFISIQIVQQNSIPKRRVDYITYSNFLVKDKKFERAEIILINAPIEKSEIYFRIGEINKNINKNRAKLAYLEALKYITNKQQEITIKRALNYVNSK